MQLFAFHSAYLLFRNMHHIMLQFFPCNHHVTKNSNISSNHQYTVFHFRNSYFLTDSRRFLQVSVISVLSNLLCPTYPTLTLLEGIKLGHYIR